MVTKLGNKDLNMVSTETELREMVQALNQERPSLISVDAEGWDLSRDGTLSLLALCWNDHVVYVIDVQVSLVILSLFLLACLEFCSIAFYVLKYTVINQTYLYNVHDMNVFYTQISRVPILDYHSHPHSESLKCSEGALQSLNLSNCIILYPGVRTNLSNDHLWRAIT